jgi:inorganic phosphate transporter, PiT family
VNSPFVYAGLARLTHDIADQVQQYGAIAKVPSVVVQNVRNDMYLASEAIRLMQKQDLAGADQGILTTFKSALPLDGVVASQRSRSARSVAQ